MLGPLNPTAESHGHKKHKDETGFKTPLDQAKGVA